MRPEDPLWDIASKSAYSGVSIDRIDAKILSILQHNGRISKKELSSEVNLSPSACIERMKKLEDAKIITSYNAVVDIKLLCKLNYFYMEVVLKSHRSTDFSVYEKYINGIDEVIECAAVGGGFDYILKVACNDIDHYQRLVDNMLEARVGVERFFSYVIMKMVKPYRQPSVAALAARR